MRARARFAPRTVGLRDARRSKRELLELQSRLQAGLRGHQHQDNGVSDWSPNRTDPIEDCCVLDYSLLGAAREIVSEVFRRRPEITTLALSIFSVEPHPTLGHDQLVCSFAAIVSQRVWGSIRHHRVDDANVFKNEPFRLAAPEGQVMPFAPSAEQSPEETIDWDAISPHDFELLVAGLFSRLGFTTMTTQQSHDGGIDVVAADDTPITGGRVVVQCKRHAGTIGASVVRDLYGALTHERAMKEILITTSSFSVDARRFAEGKPLELIDGATLRRLLESAEG